MAEVLQHTHNFPRFNVLEYVKKLRLVNFTQEQAEVQALEMENVVSRIANDIKTDIKQELHTDELVTKKDIEIIRLELQKEIEMVRKEIMVVRKEIEMVKLELQKETEIVRKEIVQSSNKLIFWVAGLLLTSGLIQHFFK